MTWSKETTLWCDVCAEWEQHCSSTVREARAAARRSGWVRKGARDLCARCAERDDKGGPE